MIRFSRQTSSGETDAIIGLDRLICGLALACCLRSVAGATVIVDGDFGDWEQPFTPIAAPVDDDSPLGAARALQDDAALYLSIRLRTVRNLQSMPATLALVFTPAEDAAGAPYQGLPALRALEFSPPDPDGGRFGARILSARNGAWQVGPLAGSGVLSAPTHSSSRFEIRVPRSVIPPGAGGLAIVYQDDGGKMTQSPVVELAAIAEASIRGPRPPALGRPSSSQLRVLVWNVGGAGFERYLWLLAAVVRRLNVDLLMLDETAPGLANGLAKALPKTWRVIGGTSGGRQRGVLASRHPLRPVTEFKHLAYPDEALELVAREGTRFMREDLEKAREEGVAAAAAVLEFAGRDWLLVSADLQCCGRDGSVEDRMRVYQAGVIRSAVERAAAAPGLGGVLIGGDLNLVGSRTPLEILAGEPNGPAGALEPVRALQTDGLSNHTWGRPNDRFPPGRLDFLLRPPALEAVNALALDPADVGADNRPAAELAAVSDHHPLIVDFRIVSPPGRVPPARAENSRSGGR